MKVVSKDGIPYELHFTEVGKDDPSVVLLKNITELMPSKEGARIVTSASTFYAECDYMVVYEALERYRKEE